TEMMTSQYGARPGKESEQPLLCLRSRSKGLMVNACAHAVFFCKLLQALRDTISHSQSPEPVSFPTCLKVGIIGGGHAGKQLARVLLELSGISAQNIHISTRRPETLSEFQQLGVECFYDNGQLVAWAEVVFLCCLPSHLLHICSGIHAALREPCIVYSLVTAVPLPRLKQLLSYSAILKPQYQCTSRDLEDVWGTNGTIRAALQDPFVIQATCPCKRIAVTGKWLEAIFYAALNSCMWRHLPHQQALKLLNDVCFPEHCPICAEKQTSCPQFVLFSLPSTFPWFDLVTVQLKASPFSQFLARSVHLQKHLTLLYCTSFGVLLRPLSYQFHCRIHMIVCDGGMHGEHFVLQWEG
uniref:NADP-dependent oxidoreductase domain-containing protein 1 n=1 Tax=Pelusios castaneus TaxID=367368 RepID=A0A8C8VEA2_9SAUR